MWSVRTVPCFVLTVQPSISGSRSRCTPSRETSAPWYSERRATLSISSRNTMPFCSTASSARRLSSSSSTSFAASSSWAIFSAARTLRRRVLLRPGARFANMPCSWLVISSMPGGAMISTPTGAAVSSMSISRSSSSPSRSFLRNTWRAAESRSGAAPGAGRAGGSSASRMRSSAASSARSRTLAISDSRCIFSETSTRSRTIDSTSRPT